MPITAAVGIGSRVTDQFVNLLTSLSFSLTFDRFRTPSQAHEKYRAAKKDLTSRHFSCLTGRRRPGIIKREGRIDCSPAPSRPDRRSFPSINAILPSARLCCGNISVIWKRSKAAPRTRSTAIFSICARFSAFWRSSAALPHRIKTIRKSRPPSIRSTSRCCARSR